MRPEQVKNAFFDAGEDDVDVAGLQDYLKHQKARPRRRSINADLVREG